MGSNANYTVQSVERAIKILDNLSGNKGGISLTELSQKIGLHKSTVHRLISTLSDNGYVVQDTVTGYYKLGLKLVSLSNNILENYDVRRIGKPYLQELNAKTNEVVHLVVLNSFEAVYVDKIESHQSITINSRIGKVVPVHCTAVGKVLVSQLPGGLILKGLVEKGMKQYTPFTISDPNEYLKEIEKVRNQGYATDDNEHEPDIRCIAAPIKDYQGNIIAAISIAGPVSRITTERMEDLKFLIIETANQISKNLGYQESSSFIHSV